jgi:hexosaminidase
MGQRVSRESLAGRVGLTAAGAKHVLGMQGQLWGENLRTPQAVEYMAFPRVIALAERAWASHPSWADIEHPKERRRQLGVAWNEFANRLGQRELRRLDYFLGGVSYRLPPPGAVVRSGRVWANIEIPGLQIRYTTNGAQPAADDEVYHGPIRATGVVKLRSFDTLSRGSRTVTVTVTSR